jgi:protein-tyrosine phosphatase
VRSERLPLLFHCSAGRDRTGIGAALLLTVFGVPRQIVIADHLATNRVRKRDARCRRARPTISASPAWRAPAGHGSLEAVLENGLDPAPLARMRATLLE